MKVTTIKEAHDIGSLKLDELFGSLHIFQISISDGEDKKVEGVTFHLINIKDENNFPNRRRDTNKVTNKTDKSYIQVLGM